MIEHEIRKSLPPMPSRIAKLNVDGCGYPVPWFVAWVNGEPDFRVIDPNKIPRAINFKLCWICGEKLGKHLTFPIGPMCAVNRTISEPPSHHDCAEFSVKACPFLMLPHAGRRETNLPATSVDPAGIAIKRNPGVICLWTTRRYALFRSMSGNGARDGLLFQIGPPEQIEWFAEGRTATRAEVEASTMSGLSLLEREAEKQGDDAVKALGQFLDQAKALWPAEAEI